MGIESVTPLNTSGSRGAKRVVMCARTASNPEGEFMLAKLFTGVSSCIISEHVVRDRLNMEEVDATKREELRFADGSLVETLGQLTLSIELGLRNAGFSRGPVSREVTFMVIPDTYVKGRYDALLSNDVVSVFGNDCISRALDQIVNC
jgi:hypothetical protein